MLEKLETIQKKYFELEQALSDPNIVSNSSKFQQYAKQRSELVPIVSLINEYQRLLDQIKGNQELLDTEEDEELIEIARAELEDMEKRKATLERELKLMLLPKDDNEGKNIIVEIRAGTGGDEATLFVGDLFRMYSKFAINKGWKIDVISSHPTGVGGFKEIIFSVEGKDVYKQLKYESGVHRVQRVPITESSGRIHTSAVTVAVLPEAEEVDIEIDPNDLRIDTFRSSGPGGQSVNTTDSAVRITHIPSGIVVSCQDEKSQHKNKAKALKVLRARLLDIKQRELESQRAEERRSQIGTGDRNEKIRTYNFPQNRVTDHRIGLSLYKLESIMNGELDELTEALMMADQDEKLKLVS
ncbi:TPA: peptide chain release factor 1 [Candidatus Poribacteria bacterium]|nr:peptide chain release factor 1 [Candidatus Poribacteria bacterium]